MLAWISAGRCPVGQLGSSISVPSQSFAGNLDRLEVGDEALDLLGVERSSAVETPCRHRRAGPAVGDDECDLFRGEAVEHRVQRRRRPVDRPDLAGGRVGDGERRIAAGRVHPTVAAGAVETVLGSGREQLRTPAGELAVGSLTRSCLAARLEHPVQRQPDDDDDEQQHADELDQLEAAPFELLVVEVRLAVGRQLDLRAELLARRPGVEHGVDEPPDDEDESDEPSDRRRRQRDHSRSDRPRTRDRPAMGSGQRLRPGPSTCWSTG